MNRPTPATDGAGARRRADALAGLLVFAVTASTIAWTIENAFERYRDLRSGWSWDLAYYNQWFWSLTRGEGVLSVRPISDYTTEGPEAWRTNYLAPIRYVLLPIYALWPGPRTLLAVHAAIFWLVLPMAFILVRAETGSTAAGLLAVPLVLLTPLLWPLAWNDFREIQLGLPFALAAVHGVRGRSLGWAIAGVGGLLACRQEYAPMVASLAIVGPRAPDDIARRFRWASALWFLGLGWFLIVFFGDLAAVWGWRTPAGYLAQFGKPRAGLLETLLTAIDFLIVGLGAWAILGAAAPRLAVLALPWLYGLSAGRWSLRLLGTESWHHVRYAAPLAAMGLAAGLVGGSRLWGFAAKFPKPWAWHAGGAALSIAVLLAADAVVLGRFAQVRYPIGRDEAAVLWVWFAQVGPDDGVVAHYDVTAPLSARRFLYSYVLTSNEPPGFPASMPSHIKWVFFRPGDIATELLERQGFREVFHGPSMRVYWRGESVAIP
jgi:hypothetical protein